MKTCPACKKKTTSIVLHRSRCKPGNTSKTSSVKRTKKQTAALEASLDHMAVPPPFSRTKKKTESLVPHHSKWECFECGQVIGAKKVCKFCGYNNEGDR